MATRKQIPLIDSSASLAVTGTVTITGTGSAVITFPSTTSTLLSTAAAVTVAQGGTGATTLTGYVKGNGTSAMTAVSIATAAADILAVAYPVGAIYISTLSTNPATLMGFGTWSAYAQGEVLVGKAASGTFATAGATGGEETHLLTSAESGLPAHNHNLLSVNAASGNNGSTYPWLSDITSRTITTGSSTAADASSAHNNLQPYIVVYMWERTA